MGSWRVGARSIAAVGAAAVVAFPAQASAGWLMPPTTVAGPVPTVTAPQVAMDADGDATIVYGTFDGDRSESGMLDGQRLAARVLFVDGSFSAPVTLDSKVDADDARVATSPGGETVVAWTAPREDGSGVVKVAVGSGDGSFGAPQTVSRGNAWSVDNERVSRVAINAAGDAVVGWKRWYAEGYEKSRVEVALREAGGTFGTPLAISPKGEIEYGPVVAIDRRGGVVAAWTRYRGRRGGKFVMEVAIRPPGGRFGPVRQISRGGLEGAGPVLAMNARGDAVVLWERNPRWKKVDPGIEAIRIEAAFRPAGGSFPHRGRAISGPRAFTLDDPVAAIDSRGNVVAAWTRGVGDNFNYLETSFRPAGGRFPGAGTVLARSANYDAQALAMDDAGNAYLAWARYDERSDTESLLATTRPFGGTFAKPTTVQRPFDFSSFHAQEVAAGGAGHAIVVWPQTEYEPSFEETVFASTYLP